MHGKIAQRTTKPNGKQAKNESQTQTQTAPHTM